MNATAAKGNRIIESSVTDFALVRRTFGSVQVHDAIGVVDRGV